MKKLSVEQIKNNKVSDKSIEESLEDIDPLYDAKESFKESLRQMKAMREGKMPKRNWRDSFEKLKKEIDEDEQ